MSGFAKPEKGKAHAKVMVYGPAGVGKTHFSLTFPHMAMVDTEGGTAFFTDRNDAGLRNDWQVANERSYRGVLALLEGIESGDVPCESVGIDSATSIYNVLSLALSNDGDKQLSPQDWGKLKARFKAVLDFMYDSLPKHIVITAQEKPEYAREGETVRGRVVKPQELVVIGYIPDVDKKAEYACDFVFRVTVEGESKDAVRWFECVKSRAQKFVKGTRYRDLSFESFKDIVAGGVVRTGQTDSQAAAQDARAAENAPSDVPFEGDRGALDGEGGGKEPTIKDLSDEIVALFETLKLDKAAKDQFVASYSPDGKPSFKGIKKPTLVEMLGQLHTLREMREADGPADGAGEPPGAEPKSDLVKAAEEAGLIPAEMRPPCHPDATLVVDPAGKAHCATCGLEVDPAAKPAATSPESALAATPAATADAGAGKAPGSPQPPEGASTAALVEAATGQKPGTVKKVIDRVPDTSGESTRAQRGQAGMLRREITALRPFTEAEYRGLCSTLTGKVTMLEMTADQADRVIKCLIELKENPKVGVALIVTKHAQPVVPA